MHVDSFVASENLTGFVNGRERTLLGIGVSQYTRRRYDTIENDPGCDCGDKRLNAITHSAEDRNFNRKSSTEC